MEKLIKVTEERIGDDVINACNARDLWEYLGSNRKFTDWMLYRIKKTRYVEGVDYVVFHNIVKNSSESGGRPRNEYIISIDMAKSLAQLEDNDRGEEIRRYFIKMERAALQLAKNPETAIIKRNIQTMLLLKEK